MENSLSMLHSLTHFHKLNTYSVGGCVYSLPLDSILHIPSFHLSLTNMSLPNYTLLQFDLVLGMINKHEENVHWWLIISSACVLSNLMYCSHKNEWMLLTQEPTFVIFIVVTQEPTIRKQVEGMNVVKTRTNICHIHGCHTKTNHK